MKKSKKSARKLQSPVVKNSAPKKPPELPIADDPRYSLGFGGRSYARSMPFQPMGRKH